MNNAHEAGATGIDPATSTAAPEARVVSLMTPQPARAVNLLKTKRCGQPPGESHSRAIYSHKDVQDIREQYAQGGLSYLRLSRIFGGTAGTVRDVVTWKTYRNAGGHTSHAKDWSTGSPRRIAPHAPFLREGEALTFDAIGEAA
jgi:hypothetical protein